MRIPLKRPLRMEPLEERLPVSSAVLGVVAGAAMYGNSAQTANAANETTYRANTDTSSLDISFDALEDNSLDSLNPFAVDRLFSEEQNDSATGSLRVVNNEISSAFTGESVSLLDAVLSEALYDPLESVRDYGNELHLTQLSTFDVNSTQFSPIRYEVTVITPGGSVPDESPGLQRSENIMKIAHDCSIDGHLWSQFSAHSGRDDNGELANTVTLVGTTSIENPSNPKSSITVPLYQMLVSAEDLADPDSGAKRINLSASFVAMDFPGALAIQVKGAPGNRGHIANLLSLPFTPNGSPPQLDFTKQFEFDSLFHGDRFYFHGYNYDQWNTGCFQRKSFVLDVIVIENALAVQWTQATTSQAMTLSSDPEGPGFRCFPEYIAPPTAATGTPQYENNSNYKNEVNVTFYAKEASNTPRTIYYVLLDPDNRLGDAPDPSNPNAPKTWTGGDNNWQYSNSGQVTLPAGQTSVTLPTPYEISQGFAGDNFIPKLPPMFFCKVLHSNELCQNSSFFVAM